MVIQVKSTVKIPKIVCPKAMVYNNQKVIKLACKLMQPQTEMRVAFNITGYNQLVKIDFLNDEPN